MEPIVTAEELFRQKALEKQKSEPPQVETPSSAPPASPIVDDISLEGVRGFEDLPEAAQLALAKSASLTTLSTDEEVGSFGAALVTRGRVGIMPAIADVASSVAKPGDIVFTRGTLSDGVALRVVALESQTTVASWSEEALRGAMADCPWVADELRLVADRFQADAGAVLGPLGDRLDDVLRDLVMSRLEVKAYAPDEVIVEEGKPVPGLHVVGGGRVELSSASGPPSEAGPGEFLFAAEVLGARKAHATARAGKGGALILFAPRSAAHELLLSVPTLIEILSD
jgi:CRP-like cAMP-binding protein